MKFGFWFIVFTGNWSFSLTLGQWLFWYCWYGVDLSKIYAQDFNEWGFDAFVVFSLASIVGALAFKLFRIIRGTYEAFLHFVFRGIIWPV